MTRETAWRARLVERIGAKSGETLLAMFDRLKPGGHLFIADYGVQPTLATRLAFRLTVQMLDGTTNPQSNANGILPQLIDESGFIGVRLIDRFGTITGSIRILAAQKPRTAAVEVA